jgi:hypothetical protein
MVKKVALLFFCILVFGCTNKSEKIIKSNEGKKIIIKNHDLPVELQEINIRINKRLPEISFTVLGTYSDSIYFMDIYNNDSTLVGKYSILPVLLSTEKIKEYEYWAFGSSCTIGLLNPKIIRYKNYVFSPSCGFNNQSDKELMTKFYLSLEDLQ